MDVIRNRTVIIKYKMSFWSVGNLADMLDVAKRFSFQAILNATVSVDTFFLLRYTALRIYKVKCCS